MKLVSIIISFIIMTGVLMGLGNYYIDIQNVYNPENSTNETSFKNLNQSFEKIDIIMQKTENRTVGIAEKGITNPSAWADAVMAFIDVGAVMLEIPQFLATFIPHTYDLFPFVPLWFKIIVVMILAIIFTMKVAGIFTKSEL